MAFPDELIAGGKDSTYPLSLFVVSAHDRATLKKGGEHVMLRLIAAASALAIMSLGFGYTASAAQVSINPGAVFQDCADCPEMVVVPPGSFKMGFDGGEEGRYEGPIRDISIEYSFAAGRTEVTQAQYAEFVASTGHNSGTGCAIWNGETWYHTPGADWRDPGYGRDPAPNEPVSCVTWWDAEAYTLWLKAKTGKRYRLLNESEWEYAARAGVTGTYTWGDDPNGGCEVANHYDVSGTNPNIAFVPVTCDDGFAGVAPVGSLKPNAFGLYDMTGNVWEWVEDCYVMPIPPEPTDGSSVQASETCDRRAVKGGAWPSSLFWQRPTFRGRDPEDRISHIFGFRIARDLAAE